MNKLTEDINTGIPCIDYQYKELMLFLNETLELSKTEPLKYKIIDELDFFAFCIAEHFYNEEQLQIENDYPDYVRHKWLHEAFIEDFMTIRFTYEYGDISTDELISMLTKKVLDQIIHHIKKEDITFSKYHNYLCNLHNFSRPKAVGVA